MTPSSFCRAKVRSRCASQPSSNRPAVLVDPLARHVVRRVGGAGGEVDEERLVGHERLLLPNPADRVVGEVLRQVVPLLGRRRRLDRGGSLVKRRVPLVVLAADEPVERLETSTGGGPGVERTHGRALPHRHLVTLAELCGGVAVELQGQGQRCLGVRAERAVAGRRCRGLGDAPHPDRVVVPAGQQRLPGRCAQRRGVEPVVEQAAVGQPLCRRSGARPSERAGGAEPDVVEQDHQDVGRSLRRQQRLDRRVRRVRVLRVVRRQAGLLPVGDRQHRAGMSVRAHHVSPSSGGRLTRQPCQVGMHRAAGSMLSGRKDGGIARCGVCVTRGGRLTTLNCVGPPGPITAAR